MRKILMTTVKTSTVLIGGALMAQAALASGYHFGAQAVSALSTANSSAAEAGDPSTIFFNPAGLTKLEGTQISGSLFLVAPSVKYSNAKGYYNNYNPNSNGAPIEGKTSGKITKGVVLVPQTYASHQLNDRFSLGLGVYVPFASETEYQRDSVLRYNVNKTGMKSFNINPTLAFKINDRHSIGVGLIGQYLEAELRQYADFGPGLSAAAKAQAYAKIDSATVPGTTLPVPPAIKEDLKKQASEQIDRQLRSGRADGYADIKGSDWGFGYNLGWLWDVSDNVRVGASYRSKVSHTLKGDGKWSLVGPAFGDGINLSLQPNLGGSPVGSPIKESIPGGAFEAGVRGLGYVASEDGTVKVATPDSLSVHGMWKVNPKWNLYGNVTYTRHSYLNKIVVDYANKKTVPAATPTAENEGKAQSDKTTIKPNWRNTYSVGIGATYQLSEPLQLRFGFNYDQSPVRNANDRLSTMPDNNRMTFGVGGKYDINKKSSLNVAYAFMKVNKTNANVNGWCGGTKVGAGSESCVSSRTNGSADFKTHAHILGMQYTYKF